MAADAFSADKTLTTAFRGYARDQVDDLLEEIEKSQRAVVEERDQLRTELANANWRLAEVTAQLESDAGQKQAVADALIEAERLKAEVESQVQAVKAAAEYDAEKIRRDAKVEAEAVVAAAEARAAELVDEVQQSLSERRQQAEHLLDDAREQLGSLVESLFDQISAASREHDAPLEPEQV